MFLGICDYVAFAVGDVRALFEYKIAACTTTRRGGE